MHILQKYYMYEFEPIKIFNKTKVGINDILLLNLDTFI